MGKKDKMKIESEESSSSDESMEEQTSSKRKDGKEKRRKKSSDDDGDESMEEEPTVSKKDTKKKEKGKSSKGKVKKEIKKESSEEDEEEKVKKEESSEEDEKEDKQKRKKKLSAHLEEKKRLVVLTNEAPLNTRSMYYSGTFLSEGVDNSFILEELKKNMKIVLNECSEETLVFDLIGLDAPIANALRRILIAEVPTMSIEKVMILNNTSIMQDEVLAHRLGLIPIKADPRMFQNKSSDEYTPQDSIEFQLSVKCTKNKNPKNSTEEEKYTNCKVYSKDLIWVPNDEQVEMLGEGNSFRPVHDDILIMKLRPGQEIDLKVYCEKGIGKDHAKFSPVSTATYRLLPEITFKKDITGKDAEELVSICPMKVFDIEDIGKGNLKATVARPRSCTMCRECIRHEKYTDSIKLGRVRDHFIFSVESTGAMPAREVFQEALKVLIEKCNAIETELDNLTTNMIP